MRKPNKGSPLQIPTAAEQSAIADAAEEYRRRPQTSVPETRPHVVKIKNTVAFNLPRYYSLALTGGYLLTNPTRDFIWLPAEIASNEPRLLAVALEPIPHNGIGEAMITGVCPAYVYVTSDAHRRATLGTNHYLESSPSGPVQLLYKPSGTGTLLCIVQLGNRAEAKLFAMTPSDGIPMATRSGDTISPGSKTCDIWYYDYATSDYVPLKDSGDSQLTATVRNPFTTLPVPGTTLVSVGEDDDGHLVSRPVHADGVDFDYDDALYTPNDGDVTTLESPSVYDPSYAYTKFYLDTDSGHSSSPEYCQATTAGVEFTKPGQYHLTFTYAQGDPASIGNLALRVMPYVTSSNAYLTTNVTTQMQRYLGPAGATWCRILDIETGDIFRVYNQLVGTGSITVSGGIVPHHFAHLSVIKLR